MLHINDLTYRIAGRTLFEAATAHIPKGHKVGLVGRNGTGKSTLFKMILGEVTVDGGAINLRQGATVATVAQEVPAGPETLLDTVLAADLERTALLAEAETTTDPDRIAHVHTRLADIDAHTAPARAARILAGLGFNEEAQGRACADFSGGWRMRVALAASLFAKPDLLLLDEPTNHLDLEATMWLESYLATWEGTIIVISHDRTLLNQSVNEILHLSETRLTRYNGGYDFFEKTRREQQAGQSSMRTKQLAERKRIQSFVDRFRAKASKARQAQSRMKLLEKMEPIAAVIEDKTTTFNFPDPPPLSPPLVALDEVSVGYEEGKPILTKLDLRIDMDDRIALLGANGNGKSTMIKLLSGRLKPMHGKLVKSSKLMVGYFAQHQAEEFPVSETAFQYMSELMEMETQTRVRAHLGSFGFSATKADTPIEKLSGGEKARLLFAAMSRGKPHIMLLDEPTNHLDVDAREALVEALNGYDGAVVLVSHDPHLIELVCDRLWVVEDGACQPFEGDMGDYRQLLLERRRGARRGKSDDGDKTTVKTGTKTNKKEERRLRAEARQAKSGLSNAVKTAEKDMARLAKDKARIEAEMAKPELYDGPPEKLTRLQIELGKVEQKLSATEERWLQAQSNLEQSAPQGGA